MNNTDQNNHENVHHVIPFAMLTKVFVVLIVLTVATVFFAKGVHLGLLSAPVAFLIAFVKAMLVMSIFMGLKYETAGNRIIFASGFFFLALLAAICFLDIYTRLNIQSTL